MAKYIDEYLIALGFDLNSEQGKEYLKVCNDIEQKQKELEKAGQSASEQAKRTTDTQKSVVEGNRNEADSINHLLDAKGKLSRTPKEGTTPAVKQTTAPQKSAPPAPAEPQETVSYEEPQTYTAPKQTPPKPSTRGRTPAPVQSAPPVENTEKKSSDESKRQTFAMGDLEKSIKQLSSAWEQLERGNIFGAFSNGASSVKSFNNYLGGLNNSFNTTNTRAGTLKKTLADVFGGGTSKAVTSSLGEAESGASAAGGSGLAMAAGAVGIAAGVAAVSKGVWDIAEGFQQTNINIETMARKLWITDSAMYQMDGTLSSMGKTTADLNDIFINPTLNKQFQTLQNFQKQYLKIPSDLEQARDSWSENIETPLAETNLQIQYLGTNLKLNLQKGIENIFSGLYKDLPQKVESAAVGLLNGIGLPNVSSQIISAMGESAKTAQTYAPQNYSYALTEGAKVTYSPTNQVNVYPNSNNSSEIASVTSQAVQQAQDYQRTALIKSIQGINR